VAVGAATEYIGTESPGSSTNLYAAIEAAMQMITEDQVEGKYVNQVIFVTDGMANVGVTEPEQILNGIYAVNSKMAASPISMFGIGIGDDQGTQWLSKLHYPLIRQISIQNGGLDIRVKRSETKQDLLRFYRILESPQMAQIRVSYESEEYTVSEMTQRTFNTLYAGTDLVICGKLERKTEGVIERTSDVMVTAVVESVGKEDIRKSFHFDSDRGNNGQMDVQRIWAYLTLKNYEKLLLQNEEIVDDQMRRLINANALNVALTNKLVTPWTSMVVVAETSIGEEDVEEIDIAADIHAGSVPNRLHRATGHGGGLSAAFSLGRLSRGRSQASAFSMKSASFRSDAAGVYSEKLNSHSPQKRMRLDPSMQNTHGASDLKRKQIRPDALDASSTSVVAYFCVTGIVVSVLIGVIFCFRHRPVGRLLKRQ